MSGLPIDPERMAEFQRSVERTAELIREAGREAGEKIEAALAPMVAFMEHVKNSDTAPSDR